MDETYKQKAIRDFTLRKGCQIYTTRIRQSKDGATHWIKVFMVQQGIIINISEEVTDVLGGGWYDFPSHSVIFQDKNSNVGWHLIRLLSQAVFKHWADDDIQFKQISL